MQTLKQQSHGTSEQGCWSRFLCHSSHLRPDGASYSGTDGGEQLQSLCFGGVKWQRTSFALGRAEQVYVFTSNIYMLSTSHCLIRRSSLQSSVVGRVRRTEASSADHDYPEHLLPERHDPPSKLVPQAPEFSEDLPKLTQAFQWRKISSQMPAEVLRCMPCISALDFDSASKQPGTCRKPGTEPLRALLCRTVRACAISCTTQQRLCKGNQ